MIAGFVRGLSVRDVEATLADALGAEAALSKSTVSSDVPGHQGGVPRPGTRRRLDEVELDYLFLDASFFQMHPGAPAEPVLAAWGITTDGTPVFVGLAPGAGESADAWDDFLRDLKDRGLRPPLLVISDGAPGLINATEQAFPRALRQRCLIHRARNILAKMPAGMQAEVQDAYWADLRHRRPEARLPARSSPRSSMPGSATMRRPTYAATLPGRGEVPDHRPRAADRLPAVPRRAPPPHPALQLHRAHLRRDPPPRQGHRPPARRDQLPDPGLGRARPGLPRLARPDHDHDGLRLLQDLRRSLLDPPAPLRPRTVTTSQSGDSTGNVMPSPNITTKPANHARPFHSGSGRHLDKRLSA